MQGQQPEVPATALLHALNQRRPHLQGRSAVAPRSGPQPPHYSGGQGRQLIEHPFELGIIVGPVIAAKLLQRPGLKSGDLFSQLQVQGGEIEAGQGEDLIGTAAQGGEVKNQTA